MGFSELVDQLAFGRSLPKLDSCVGIYLSSKAVFVAELRLKGGKPVVEHLVRLAVPSNAANETRMTGVLSTDILADTERLSALIRQAMAQGKWSSSHAVVTLSHHFGLLRYFMMPKIDAKYWQTAVPAEAKKYVPVQFDDLASDFQIRSLEPGPDLRPRQGALYGVTQNKNLENVRALISKLGLKLAGLELSPCSVGRLWDELGGSRPIPYAQVHFDSDNVHVLISEKGIPVFVREVLLGPDAKVADRRKLDLAGCLEFAQKQLGVQKPPEIRVSGSNPELHLWREAFAQEAGSPVSLQDPAKALGLKAGEWGGYAALGAALRALKPNAVLLDLATEGKIDAIDRKVVRTVIASSAAVAALLFCLGMGRLAWARAQSQELRRLTRGNMPEAFKGKKLEAIEQMVNELQRRADSVRYLADRKSRVSGLLEQLSEDIPREAWLTQIEYTHPLEEALTDGAGAKHLLTLSGNVWADNKISEQDIAYRFRDTLYGDERFRAVFKSVEAAVSGSEAGKEKSRTRFTIQCSAGRKNAG